MLFRKKRPSWLKQLLKNQEIKESLSTPDSETFLIERDMMLKGTDVPRGNKIVKQFAVMVNGAVHVVTSGDRVNRSVYKALLEAGAIIPIPGVDIKPRNLSEGNIRIEDDSIIDDNSIQ
ncbi:MAG: hypothetical protein LDL53_09900 [Candidatus Hydrogenedens sp.]|nr:hypothetical protein [Candidatus Hydrogenedens sp.]